MLPETSTSSVSSGLPAGGGISRTHIGLSSTSRTAARAADISASDQDPPPHRYHGPAAAARTRRAAPPRRPRGPSTARRGSAGSKRRVLMVRSGRSVGTFVRFPDRRVERRDSETQRLDQSRARDGLTFCGPPKTPLRLCVSAFTSVLHLEPVRITTRPAASAGGYQGSPGIRIGSYRVPDKMPSHHGARRARGGLTRLFAVFSVCSVVSVVNTVQNSKSCAFRSGRI